MAFETSFELLKATSEGDAFKAYVTSRTKPIFW
jgi:hypothetical protein